MLKRRKLESMLSELSDDEFAALWKGTYGNLPSGRRIELASDYVAEQYDSELDGCIAAAESILTHTPKPPPKPKSKWLPPR